METNELVTILQDQKNNLNILYSTVTQKQRALVSSDYELLEDSISKEEHALLSIQQTEKLRINALHELYKQFSINPNSTKLQEFVEKTRNRIGDETGKKILKLEKDIKEIITLVNNINQQNKYLIDQSRTFIRETIQSVLAIKKTLLDKRV